MQYRHLPPVARQAPRVAGREGRQGGLEVIHRTCPPASVAPRAARHSPAWNSPAGRRGSPRPRSRRHRGSHRCCRSPNPAGWGRTASAGWRRRGGGLPPSPPPARRGSAGSPLRPRPVRPARRVGFGGRRREVGARSGRAPLANAGLGHRDRQGVAIIARAGACVADGAGAGPRPAGDGRCRGRRGKLPDPDLHWRVAAGRLSPVLHSLAMDRCHQGVVRDALRQKKQGGRKRRQG